MKVYIFVLGFFVALFTSEVRAQDIPVAELEVNKDDLGDVTDAFQEHFFEALKQKAIENYDKAIAALQKCEKIEPDNAVVHFELGKNYKLQGNLEAAIHSLQKANRLKPDQQWVMVELMESYYANKDFEEAILVAQRLVKIDDQYYNNLADLYFQLERYDELLALLDRLDAELGITEYRLGLRQKIYALNNNTPAQIQVIKDAIRANPDNESNYLNLIFVYSDAGMEKEAFAAAEEMKNKFPTSRVVHLALYKFYLNSGNLPAALASMKLVLNAEEIDPGSKLKVLNDFLLFVNENPTYENELKEVITIFSETENSPEVYQKLGEYYLKKNQREQALIYMELGVKSNLDNYQLVNNTLLLQLDLERYEEAVKLSREALDIFPAQPVLYLYQGKALNKTGSYKEAAEILTFGLDFLLDDPEITKEFYEQLILAYKGAGNEQKATEFKEKQSQLNKKIN